MEIYNVKVYDLEESVIACRYAMKTERPKIDDAEFTASLQRAVKLVAAGSPHCNFRTGIRVSFDIKYPQYISPEMQRYHWIDIVTSASKMHRLLYMDFDKCFNQWVTEQSKQQMRELVAEYNADPSEERFMKVLSNCPLGLELFMRVSTNYEQLATIYRQRKTHKLPEWREFCKWIETLPYSQQLITNHGNKTM